MQLTEEQVRELEAGMQRMAEEGNPLATDRCRRLAECETPAEKAAILAQLDDDLRQAESAIATMTQGFAAAINGTPGPALQQAMEHALSVMQGLCDALWRAYRQAGMPYGETEDDLLRWLSEQRAVVAARERDEERRRREWAALDLRYHLQTGKHLAPEHDELL